MFITHIIYIYKQFQKKSTTNAVANIVLLHIIKLYVLKHIGQIYKLLLFFKIVRQDWTRTNDPQIMRLVRYLCATAG